MNKIIECYLVNRSKLMLLLDERIAHWLRTVEFGVLPEDWQRKNKVYYL